MRRLNSKKPKVSGFLYVLMAKVKYNALWIGDVDEEDFDPDAGDENEYGVDAINGQ